MLFDDNFHTTGVTSENYSPRQINSGVKLAYVDFTPGQIGRAPFLLPKPNQARKNYSPQAK